MTIIHTNRKGKKSYLHQGMTKKGNPRYYFSQKSEGQLVDTIPPGFEIYETPNAQVFLRKIQPKVITDAEVEIVRAGMDQYSKVEYYQIDVKKSIISIFLMDQKIDRLSELLRFSPRAKEVALHDLVNESTTYSPMLRFVLLDKKQRRFITQRYCFLGSIDDWVEIGKSDDLAALVKRYVKHLDQDSYYELY